MSNIERDDDLSHCPGCGLLMTADRFSEHEDECPATADRREIERLTEQLAGAVDLAERYGQAIVDISAALGGDLISDGARVNRVRAIIAPLDTGGSRT